MPEDVIQAVYERKPKAACSWNIDVKRVSMSATQGNVCVRINGKTIARFADDIQLMKDGHYASAIPDEELGRFVAATFWHPNDEAYHLSDRAKDVFNPAWRKTSEQMQTPKECLHVDTPVGELYAYPASDPNYPGIYIDLHRDGYAMDAPLVLLDFSKTEFPECKTEQGKDGVLVCRCWRDATKEDYSEKDRVIFKKYDDFFREQTKE